MIWIDYTIISGFFLLLAGIAVSTNRLTKSVAGFLFSLTFTLQEYLPMWTFITSSIFIGGAGCAVVGGLYWSRGTIQGAWTSVIIGSTLSAGTIILKQFWQDIPALNNWIPFEDLPNGLEMSCMAACFGQGDLALDRLNNLRPFLQPNTMYTENGPVIETPLSATESIHEMLLQSWTDPNRKPRRRTLFSPNRHPRNAASARWFRACIHKRGALEYTACQSGHRY